MVRNYFKLAWRNLWKRKSFTFLNIIGLSVAFGVAILLCTAALFDLSYDKFHANINSLYKAYTTIQSPKGQEAGTAYPVPFAPALKAEVPGIKKITRYRGGPVNITYNTKELNMSVARVDADFFDMFSFPVLSGNKQNPLQKLTDIVITEETAEKLFNTKNGVGKTITLTIEEEQKPFTVSAVLKELPQQSSTRFDVAIRFESGGHYENNIDKWNNHNHEVYIQLEENSTAAKFEKSSQQFSSLHFKDAIESAKRDGAKADANGQHQQLRLLSVADEHFVRFDNGFAAVSKVRVYMIIGIALVILFIACVNFINMSIGISVQRLREIGMRKTLGAVKTQLFFQFWGESLIVFLVSVILGALLSNLLLGQFKTLFRIQASFTSVITPVIGIGFLISFLLVTLFAGGYPALLLSKLGTLQSLKGKLDVNRRNRLRNALMVVQFSIAVLLISGTLVLWSQLKYMQNKELGFNKEQVIAFPLNGKKNGRMAVQLLRNELKDKPGIVGVSAADNILGRGKDGSASTSILGFEHKGRTVNTHMLVVDYDYTQTLDMQLVAGRSFSREYGNDSLSVVINEAMAKELGEKDPLNATVMLFDSVKYFIVGVVKDYHFQGLDRKIEPISMFMKSDWGIYFAYVKAAPQNLPNKFEMVKNAWKKVEPNAEFMGSFLDENIDRTFRSERVMTTIITSGAIIAILLSCMGLFAISLLVVTQRTKEIGIRKIVGASVSSITILLSKEFLKLVGIALLIATPLAWVLTDKWLQEYAYRIQLSPLFFVLAGVIAIIIAFFTISFRTIKAAVANPVKSLRTE